MLNSAPPNKGCAEKPGVNNEEVYAPVRMHATLRAMLAYAVRGDLELRQVDVSTAFLYADIDRELYMQQPPGFADGSGRVCHLLKNIFGTKQGPCVWHQKLVSVLQQPGFEQEHAEPGLFVLHNAEGRTLMLPLSGLC
jgi:hypothetical protein